MYIVKAEQRHKSRIFFFYWLLHLRSEMAMITKLFFLLSCLRFCTVLKNKIICIVRSEGIGKPKKKPRKLHQKPSFSFAWAIVQWTTIDFPWPVRLPVQREWLSGLFLVMTLHLGSIWSPVLWWMCPPPPPAPLVTPKQAGCKGLLVCKLCFFFFFQHSLRHGG